MEEGNIKEIKVCESEEKELNEENEEETIVTTSYEAPVMIETVNEIFQPKMEKIEYIPLEYQEPLKEPILYEAEVQECPVQMVAVEEILQPLELKPEINIEPVMYKSEVQKCPVQMVAVEEILQTVEVEREEYIKLEPKMCQVKFDSTCEILHPIKVEKEHRLLSETKPLGGKLEQAQIEEEELLYDSADEKVLVDFENEIVDKSDLNGIDLVFVIESTKIIQDQIEKIRNFCRKLMRDAQNCVDKFTETNGIGKFGVVLYRDYDSAYTTKVFDLDSRVNTKDILTSQTDCAEGNKDSAAVLKGLNEAVSKISWRKDSQKFIFHLLSTPPASKELEIDSNDSFLNPEDLFLSMREAEIDYTVVTFSNKLEKTVSLFTSFYECSLIKINVADK